MIWETFAIGSHIMGDMSLAFGPIVAVLYYKSHSIESASIEVLQQYFDADGFVGSLWQAAISNGPLWAIYWAICTSVPPFVAAIRDLLLAWSAAIYLIWKSAEWCILFYFNRVANPDFRFLFVVTLILATYGFFILGFWYHLTRCLIRLFVAIARLTAYCTQKIIAHAERLLLASVDVAFWGFRALTLPLVVALNYWMESYHEVNDVLAGPRHSSKQGNAALAVTFRRLAVVLYVLYIFAKTVNPVACFIQRCLFGTPAPTSPIQAPVRDATDDSPDLTTRERPETPGTKMDNQGEPVRTTVTNMADDSPDPIHQERPETTAARIEHRKESARFTDTSAPGLERSQRTFRHAALFPGHTAAVPGYYPSSAASEASTTGWDSDQGHSTQQSVGRRRSPRFAPVRPGN